MEFEATHIFISTVIVIIIHKIVKMQHQTFFALFCVMSLGLNAFVSGVPARPMSRLSLAGMKQKDGTSLKMIMNIKIIFCAKSFRFAGEI